MKWIVQAWHWFNGKKTNIGMFISGVGTLLMVIPIPIAPWIPEALLIIGGMIGGTGLIHKGEKEIKKQGGVKATFNKLTKK